jgi:LETM1 and EF-hand domain-containing protein 1
MEELAKEQKRKAAKRQKEMQEAGVALGDDDSNAIAGLEESAASMLEFLEKARNGEIIPPDVIIRYANYFHDDLTLDNMPRMQIINMCKYMSIPPYGSESFLRFQLRHKIRVLKEDDQRILWEGIDALTKMELREACQERGMRSTGLSKDAYRRALQQWLDLSVNKNVPISLLVMSRTFFLHEEMFERKSDESNSVTGLADAISGLDKEVLNQVILEVATSEEQKSNPDIFKIKLEVLSQQNELIRQEQAVIEAAAKKKEKAEPQSSDNSPKDSDTDLAASASSVAPGKERASSRSSSEAKIETEDKDDHELSTEEMDALSQLVSGDSVSKERAELERIKSAMKAEKNNQEPEEVGSLDAETPEAASAPKQVTASDPMSSEEADRMVADTVEKIERQAEAEAKESTKIEVHADSATNGLVDVVDEEEEEPEDPIVARLKKRIESMVDKIEVQLSDVQVKIGDKMHWLDKDQDGILTREEMADVLQQVLKREITFEEAMEIAGEMV